MFAINVYTLPSLTTHDACDRWYNSSKPPKGKAWRENERPLDDTRAHHKRIVKNDDGSYSLYLYQCEHLRYFADGDVAVELYPSLSSKRFVERMLPMGVSVHCDTGVQLIWVVTEQGDQWVRFHKALRLSPTGTRGIWNIKSQMFQRYRQYVSRSKASAVRRKLKPLFDFADASVKIDPQPPRYARSAMAYLDQIENMDIWHELVPYALDRQSFIEMAYDHFGVRYDVPIPNSTPPTRGRSIKYT